MGRETQKEIKKKINPKKRGDLIFKKPPELKIKCPRCGNKTFIRCPYGIRCSKCGWEPSYMKK